MMKASIVIYRPIETIFAYVSDGKRFLQESQANIPTKFFFFGIPVSARVAQIEEIQQTSSDPVGVATTFVQKNTYRDQHSESNVQIVEYDPPHRITYRFTGSMIPGIEFKIMLNAVSNGTKVTEVLRIEQGFIKHLSLFLYL